VYNESVMPTEAVPRRPLVASLLAALAGLPLAAQQPSGSYVPKQSDRPEPIEGDEPGFQPMFDGKTLDGWEGDPKYWRVEDGALVGEITPETIIKSNTFIIWRGGAPKDFELKADYRITARGNSGINYRSVVVPDRVTPANKFAMRGYQADIDGQNTYTGQNYEEKGRLFLATRGQMTHVTGGRKPIVLSILGDSVELGKAITSGWNRYHLIARANVLIHILNGRLMCAVMDDDATGRSFEGLIGVQVHVGPPMKVEYRNFRLKNL
jgi:hypothetical protein